MRKTKSHGLIITVIVNKFKILNGTRIIIIIKLNTVNTINKKLNEVAELSNHTTFFITTYRAGNRKQQIVLLFVVPMHFSILPVI